MANAEYILKRMREISECIREQRDEESVLAVTLADYFQQLDETLCTGPDFPRDWVPF